MNVRQQSSTSYPVLLYMVLASDHITPATGKTVTVTASKNGGGFAAVSGAVTEIASGWYAWAGNATDRDTLGPLAIRATASACDEFAALYEIVPWGPFDANLALTNLNATVSSRATAAAVWTVSSASPTSNTFGSMLAATNTLADSAQQASASAAASATLLLAALGAWTGTGINTVLGAFKALFRKTGATAPSDIGGTFDPTTDSLEALRDRGDAAWITGTGASSLPVTVSVAQIAQGASAAAAGLGELEIVIGDTWTQPLLGLGSLTGRTSHTFFVKRSLSDADTASMIEIEETAGLVRLAGASATAGQGTLTVNDATNGSDTLTLAAAATALLTAGIYHYTCVKVSAAGTETVRSGRLRIRR